MIKRIQVICIILFFHCPYIYAQTDAQFSQYMFNQLFINPAYTGVTGETQAGFTHRTQWAGYSPSFDDGTGINTQIAHASTAFPTLNSGLGFYVVNDQLDPVTQRELQLSYAYHVKLKNAKLSFGLKAGFFQKTLDFERLRARDANDPLILVSKESQTQFDMGAGVYYLSDGFFGGVSVNHLLEPAFNFGSDAQQNLLKKSAFAIAGYNMRLSLNWDLTPSILVKSDFNAFSVDVSAIATYNRKFWGGLAYRYQDAATVILGVNIPSGKKNIFKIGYSFDYVLSGQAGKQATSHEITLTFTRPIVIPTPRAIIRTPRFRY